MPISDQYKVGLVISVEDAPKKPLRVCQFDIGQGDPITVVTKAPNVRQGSRLAVAPIGSTIVTEQGDEVTVQKTIVGSVPSEGIFCDSKMLGWTGGSVGVAQQIPDSVPIGAAPPRTKPRPGAETSSEPSVPAVNVQPLFEKKLTKEEKKKLAEEKRTARKAAKEAKKAAEEPS